MSTEKEHSPAVTPQDVYRLALKGEIDFFEVSICSSDSSLEVISHGQSLLCQTGLDYNGYLVNSFRFVLQEIPGDPQVRIISRNREGVSSTLILEITDLRGQTFSATLISAGINNKFNRLKFIRS